MKKILIVGKVPPPIGGVSIHVSRLFAHLANDKEFETELLTLNSLNLKKTLRIVFFPGLVHLHTSNSFFKFIVCFFRLIFLFKTITTLHGDLNRFKNLNLIFEFLCIKLGSLTVVLNEGSEIRGKGISKMVVKISSFLPPMEGDFIPKLILKELENFKRPFSKTFCTNAFNYTEDKFGNEIYGIFDLIEVFKDLPDFGLIILDPSGSYQKKMEKNKLESNIFLISTPFSFYALVKWSDGVIRNTSTDGDSLSVKESLYLEKPVFATNIVSRPTGVNEYGYNDYNSLILQLKSCEKSTLNNKMNLNGFKNLKRVFRLTTK
jgi:glycosyltransferase involved in cell wall biosynthesis